MFYAPVGQCSGPNDPASPRMGLISIMSHAEFISTFRFQRVRRKCFLLQTGS